MSTALFHVALAWFLGGLMVGFWLAVAIAVWVARWVFRWAESGGPIPPEAMRFLQKD